MKDTAEKNQSPVGLRLSQAGVSRLQTDQVDIEVATSPDVSGSGLSWSLSHFRTRGPSEVEVAGSRPAGYVFSQVPLSGGYEVELTCGTRFEARTAGLVRPQKSGALFHFEEAENQLFGVLAPLETVEGWFGNRVPAAVRRLLDNEGRESYHRPQPLPAHLYQSLVGALDSRLPMQPLLVEAAAIQILGFQLERLAADTSCGLVPRELRAARDAHALMTAQPETPPGAVELAAQLGVSVKRLTTAYREVFGCTLYQAAEQMRLQAGCDALLRGEAIKLVAQRLGYANVSNFTYAFRKRMGLPPREWLNTHRRTARGTAPPAPGNRRR